MPLQKLSFEIVGEKQYSRAFEAMADEVSDMSEPLAEIGKSLVSHVHSQFRTEGADGAFGKWKALNPEYARWKQDQVGDEPILVFTGTMRAKMVDAKSAVTVTARRMVYDPDVPDYAIHHQNDEPGGPPQRKMVDLPMATRRSWDRIFVNWLRYSREIL